MDPGGVFLDRKGRARAWKKGAKMTTGWRRILFVIGVGVALRLALNYGLGDAVVRHVWETDAGEYHAIAESLRAGTGFSMDGRVPTAWRPPLYPVALAVFGRSTAFVQVAIFAAVAFWLSAGRHHGPGPGPESPSLDSARSGPN